MGRGERVLRLYSLTCQAHNETQVHKQSTYLYGDDFSASRRREKRCHSAPVAYVDRDAGDEGELNLGIGRVEPKAT